MMRSRGYTQQQIADEIHESRGYVRNRLELLATPQIVQNMLEQNPDTIRAAYYLKEVTDEGILEKAVQALLTEQITGMQVQSYVETLIAQAAREASKASPELATAGTLLSQPTQPTASVVEPEASQEPFAAEAPISPSPTVLEATGASSTEQEEQPTFAAISNPVLRTQVASTPVAPTQEEKPVPQPRDEAAVQASLLAQSKLSTIHRQLYA
jgi:ParB-like chromosome segregation protein Spo0J